MKNSSSDRVWISRKAATKILQNGFTNRVKKMKTSPSYSSFLKASSSSSSSSSPTSTIINDHVMRILADIWDIVQKLNNMLILHSPILEDSSSSSPISRSVFELLSWLSTLFPRLQYLSLQFHQPEDLPSSNHFPIDELTNGIIALVKRCHQTHTKAFTSNQQTLLSTWMKTILLPTPPSIPSTSPDALAPYSPSSSSFSSPSTLPSDLLRSSFHISWELLASLQRSLCPRCGSHRAFYCISCVIPTTPSHPPPLVLPFHIHVLLHPKLKRKASTGLQAAVLAPGFSTVYNFPSNIPHFNPETTALLYPSPSSVTLQEWLDSSFISSISSELTPSASDSASASPRLRSLENIVVLEASWNSAEPMLKHPSLSSLTQVRISTARTLFWKHQQFGQHFLSTIECIRHACVEFWKLKKEQEREEGYRFVTKEDLEKLGVGEMIGSAYLKPYLHGYFMDSRLYRKIQKKAEEHKEESVGEQEAEKKFDDLLFYFFAGLENVRNLYSKTPELLQPLWWQASSEATSTN